MVMRRGSTVSLVSIASHVYWARYGVKWLETLEQLDPRPDEVVLVSNASLKLPDYVRLVGAEFPFSVSGWLNVGRQTATGDYIGLLGLDDSMPPSAFKNLNLEGDVLVSGSLDSNGDVNIPSRRQWENCLNEPWYTLNGYQLVHRDIARLLPFRDIAWADWVASLEYFQHGLDVRFESKVRYYYNLHKEQRSNVDNLREEVANIDVVKQMIRDGGIKPGDCFPPEAL